MGTVTSTSKKKRSLNSGSCLKRESKEYRNLRRQKTALASLWRDPRLQSRRTMGYVSWGGEGVGRGQKCRMKYELCWIPHSPAFPSDPGLSPAGVFQDSGFHSTSFPHFHYPCPTAPGYLHGFCENSFSFGCPCFTSPTGTSDHLCWGSWSFVTNSPQQVFLRQICSRALQSLRTQPKLPDSLVTD